MQPKPERQAAGTVAHAGAAIHVEEFEPRQPLARALPERALDGRRRDAVGRFEGEVDVARREPAHPLIRPRTVRQIEQVPEVELEPGDSLGDTERVEHAWMHLPHDAHLVAADRHGRGTRRVQAGR